MKNIFKKWLKVLFTFFVGFILICICSYLFYFFRTIYFFIILIPIGFGLAYLIPFFLSSFSITKRYDGKYKDEILLFIKKQEIVVNKLYVLKNSRSNAFISGFANNKSITFTSNLLKNHPYDEIEAALAHELGHHKNNDSIYLTGVILAVFILSSLLSVNIYTGLFTNLIYLAFVCLFISLLTIPIALFIFRYRENKCDLYAKNVIKDPSAFARFFERMLIFEEKSGNKINNKASMFYKLFLTHPWVFDRIKLMRS